MTTAVAACALGLAHAQSGVAPEQTTFSAEDEAVRTPAAIPAPVRKILANDSSVRDLARYEHVVPEDFPTSWFSASVVHLGSGDRKGLVLVGEGPMHGANITQFWVFLETPEGYRLVLQGGAHNLSVIEKKWNGYKEIDLLSATGIAVHTIRLRLDGHEYKAFYDVWEHTQ